MDRKLGRPGAMCRAARSLLRHPARSAVFCLVVAFASCLLVSAAATLTASVQTQEEGEGAIDGEYRLELDVDNLRKRINELPPEYSTVAENGSFGTKMPSNAFQSVLEDDARVLGGVDGVDAWNLVSIPVPAHVPGLKRIEDPDRDQSSDFGGVNVIGVRDQSLEQNVERGNVELAEGRWIGPDDKGSVVVSSDFAELNGLKVGSEIEFSDAKRQDAEPVSAKVVGIFRVVHEIPSTMTGDTFRSENTMFSDMDTSQSITDSVDDPLIAYATFRVADAASYDEVGEALRAAPIDWERYQLVDDSGAAERAAENFGGLQNLTMAFMAVVAACGVVLVGLVMAFWAKSRRREAGVLLSLGCSPASVLGQVALEAVTLALAGCLIGAVVAWPVSDIVAGGMAAAPMESADGGEVAGGGDEAPVVGADAEPSMGEVAAVGGACLAVVGLAALASTAPAVARGPRRMLEISE